MVTLWTTVFGSYHRFFPEWLECAERAQPDRILVVSDCPLDIAADVIVAKPQGEFPEAFMRNVACDAADGWLWQIDVDDRIMADALSVLAGRDCDVLQVGYVSTRGARYVPSVVPNGDYLNQPNSYVSGSPFTKDMWVRAGGFPHIAWSDWGFWRRCARAGGRFEAAERVCYVYREDFADSVSGKYQDVRHVREAMAE